MRIRYGLAAAAALAVVAGGQAYAAGPESVYLGIGGGAFFLEDQDISSGVELNGDTGWVIAPTLGIRWPEGWRTELEGAHRQNDYDISGVAGSGKAKSSSVMVNVLKDLDFGWQAMPYIGGGIGAARVKYDGAVSGEDTAGIFQGIVGVSVPFSDVLEGFADYHYVKTFDTDVIADEYGGHQALVGIRWTFWNAAPPAPVAAPTPAPVAAPKDYVIYFEFDKANITQAAGAVLDELKATAGNASVDVVGHTDTSGSNDYNDALSARRANNTATGLNERGVKVDSVSGRGETEPAVQTGDGVKEPLNRRAVIKLKEAAAPAPSM